VDTVGVGVAGACYEVSEAVKQYSQDLGERCVFKCRGVVVFELTPEESGRTN